jgi:hypothetical protein
MKRTTKTFDCIELKRQAARRIFEETGQLSIEEKITYWRRRSEEFLRERKQAAENASQTR